MTEQQKIILVTEQQIIILVTEQPKIILVSRAAENYSGCYNGKNMIN